MIESRSKKEVSTVSAWRIISACALLHISGCNNDFCEDKILGWKSSPSGESRLVWFERDCGATTNFVRGVAVAALSEAYYFEDKDVFFLIEGRSEISAYWRSDLKVSVYFSGTGRPPFLQMDRFKGLEIIYR